jgi:hypothetical protein
MMQKRLDVIDNYLVLAIYKKRFGPVSEPSRYRIDGDIVNPVIQLLRC